MLPTASEVRAAAAGSEDPAEDLVYGLKLLRVAVIFALIITAISGFWSFCNAYCYSIDDPLPSSSDFYTYWLSISLSILEECFYIVGVYYCSTRLLNHVSRAPLLIALILAAIVFPDQIFLYALEKPWIYFGGLGNVHATYAIYYLGNLSWLALCFWLMLWTTAHHDEQNQRRILGLIFLETATIVLRIIDHTMYMLLLVDQPTDHTNFAVFYFVNGFIALLSFISGIIAFKIYSSLITQLSAQPAPEKQPSPLSSV